MKSKVQLKVLGLILFCFTGALSAQKSNDFERYRQEYENSQQALLWRQYQEVRIWFEDAYQEYPTVPRGALEAIAFQYSRFAPNIIYDTVEQDMTVMPRIYSVMGLTLNGKGVFRENARWLASHTPYSLDAILWQPGAAVKAYACAFAQLQRRYGLFGDSLEQYRQIFVDLCELPLPGEGEDSFALNSFLYMIYCFFSQEEYVRYGVLRRDVDFDALFGQEYARLKGGRVVVTPSEPTSDVLRGTDYPNANFVPAASCNFSSGRNGTTVSSVTVHYTQGTYSGAIAWFQNCSARASAHYVIRSVDGQVTQMVREADKAWHVGVANSYTIGIEHEAYGDIASYFTMNMYQSSANLVKNICSRRPNINPHRVFYRDTLDGGTVLNYGLHSLGGATACTQIRGHQHYPSQTHTDPGPHWNWNLYYKLINDNPSVTVNTAESGIFTDSGGPNGNYGDDERQLFLIHVAGADSIALSFSQFGLEADYDFIWIYGGGTEFSPLIGRWNTHTPGRVVAAGDKMLVEFRSDCATQGTGWRAQWNACYQNPDDSGNSGNDDSGSGDSGGEDDSGDDGPGGGDPGGDTGDDDDDDDDGDDDEEEIVVDNANPQTQINLDATQWITGDFVASFSDTDDSGIKWRFYQIMESEGNVWSANWSHGFLCDNFDNALDPSVWMNNTANPWVVQSGELRQNNESANYVGIAARHNGASHTAYLYDFYLKFNSGDQCSFFFNCGNAPSQTSLFSGYEVCFDKSNHTVTVYRLILGARRFLKSNSQVYFATGTNYFCRVIFDSSTGEIVVMRHANRLLRAVDGVLTTTPNSYIGFVTRNSAVSVDNLRVYGSRDASVSVTVGPSADDMIRVQAVNGSGRTKLKSVVVDRAYKFSNLVEKSLKVDYTAPPAVTNLIFQTETEMQPDGSSLVWLSASWNPSSDAQSGIKRYYYNHSANALNPWYGNWTDNGLLRTCQHCHAFASNMPISLSVIAENNAGLRSAATSKAMAPSGLDVMTKKEKSHFLAVDGRSVKLLPSQSIQHEHPQPPCQFTLFDMAGRKVKEGSITFNETVDVSDVSAGFYLFRLMAGSSVLATEKIVLPY